MVLRSSTVWFNGVKPKPKIGSPRISVLFSGGVKGLDRDFSVLKKGELERVIKEAGKVYRSKYKKRRVAKYGRNCRAMPSEDLVSFFGSFRPEEFRFKVLFAFQFYLGLRIGEVCRLKVSDLDLQRDCVRVVSEKKRFEQVDFLYLNSSLKELLLEYLRLYESKCVEHDGFLFFRRQSSCKFGYVSPNFARALFRRVCVRAGIDKVYSEREGLSGLPFKAGKLHLYTTHSLRHSCADLLRRNGVPIEVVKEILRHSSISTTQIYFRAGKEEAIEGFKKTFERQVFKPEKT